MAVLNKIRWEDTESAFDGLITTAIIHNLKHVDLKEFLIDAGTVAKPKIINLLNDHKQLKINTMLKYLVFQSDTDQSNSRYSPPRCHTLKDQFNFNEWWESFIIKPVLNEKEIWDKSCIGYETFKIEHLKVNIHIVYPMACSSVTPLKEDHFVKFERFQNKEKLPFVLYLSMRNVPREELSNVEHQKNCPTLLAYYLKCSFDDSLSVYRSHDYEENCIDWFVNELKKLHKRLQKQFNISCGKSNLTSEELDTYSKATNCHICNKPFTPDSIKVDDYFRLACRHNNCGSTISNYRGPAHNTCIEDYHKASKTIPVVMRKLSNDNVHYIVKNIIPRLKCDIKIFPDATPQQEFSVDILPSSIEKYISFDLDGINEDYEIKFRFLSFDRLTKELLDDSILTDFPNLESGFFDFSRDKAKLLRCHNIINPYKLVYTIDTISQSLESLRCSEDISEEKYNNTRIIWDNFNISNINDYSKLYMKRDILLLTDLSEKYRKTCLDIYHLDPLHYYTLGGFTWDSMMLKNKQQIEIVTNKDMLSFIEKGIRGGYCHLSKRRCSANNVYMPTYDRRQDSKQLIFFDMNNQYGWAMTQYLPYGGFEFEDKWVNMNIDTSRNEIMNIPYDSPIGYILEVDLEYPQILHDLHSDLPFCVEKSCPPSRGWKNKEKLLATLYDKHNYVIHYRNLKQALEYGLKLKTIHKVLKFNQLPWLKEYIDLNTKQRIGTTNKCEKDFFKFLNIIIYGKTLEDPNKYEKVILLSDKEKAKRMIADVNFKRSIIFDKNIVTMEIQNTKSFLKKPNYLGMVILELSKTSTLEFHHGYMKKQYNSNISLAYTDTDSLIYELKHLDIYNLIKRDCTTQFDTSEYPPNNIFGIPNVNKLKLGIMRDVNKGAIMTDFIGLSKKSFAYRWINQDTGETEEKLYGVRNKRKLKWNDIESCFELFIKDWNHNRCKSKYMFGLKFYHNKRYFLPNSYESLPWGHYKVPEGNGINPWFN